SIRWKSGPNARDRRNKAIGRSRRAGWETGRPQQAAPKRLGPSKALQIKRTPPRWKIRRRPRGSKRPRPTEGEDKAQRPRRSCLPPPHLISPGLFGAVQALVRLADELLGAGGVFRKSGHAKAPSNGNHVVAGL